MWSSYAQGGMNAFRRGDYAEAERLFRASITEAGKLNRGDKESADRMIVSLNGLGNALQQQGKFADEEKVNRTLLELMELARSEDDPEFAICLNNLGLSLAEQKKYEEAEQVHRRALALREKFEGAKHPDVAVSLINLGKVYQEQGKFYEAEALLTRALEILGNIPSSELDSDQAELVAMSFNNLGLIYVAQKKYEKAEGFYQNALLLITRLKGAKHPDIVQYLDNYADLLSLMKRPQEAARLLARVASIKKPPNRSNDNRR